MTMKKRLVNTAIAAALIVGGFGLAQAQTFVNFGRPDTARFRIVTEDGIATPGGQGFVPAAKVWTIADKQTGACYVIVFTPGGPAMAAASACQ